MSEGAKNAAGRNAVRGVNESRDVERPTAAATVLLRVEEMDCPSCVAKIEGRLEKLEGVVRVRGSAVARTLRVELDPTRLSAEAVTSEVGRLGYLARPDGGEGVEPARARTWTSRQARIAYVSIVLFGLALVLRFLGVAPAVIARPLHDVHLPDLLLIASALVGGWNFFPKGVRAATSFTLDMNFLMTVAILGAVAIGEYTEAAAIAFLFALAELLESYSVDRARASVAALMELAPDTATVVRDGQETVVHADDVVPHDIVVVRPGERVPVDGEVVEGTSAVDQSPITGESLPVEKGPGDVVFAGTINREGFVRVRATRAASASTLARIIRLVEEAEEGKTRSERFVERFARWYTPAVTVAAVLVVALPPLLFGAPFVPWFVRGLTLLVIACPCALVISTPVAVVSGVTAAARSGVLIKGGVYLEAMAEVRAVAFDKTGTLTVGHPRVVEVRTVDGVSETEALARAAAVEDRSRHPLARAIVDAAEERGIDRPWRVTDFTSVTAKGARARLDGVEHAVGKPEHLAEKGTGRVPADLVHGGRTVVGVVREGRILAWIALSDRPREAAGATVRRLEEAGIEHMVMLTGDHRESAEAVGRAIGVDTVLAGLMPAQKVEAVRTLEARYGGVAMVGDGVNDGPALAAATVGIAMGAAGSDTALETADVALMGDDLTRLPYLFDLSRRSRSVIRQNIGTALAVKGILALGVPLGLVSLITAVIVGDMGVSLAVTLNALRLAPRRS